MQPNLSKPPHLRMIATDCRLRIYLAGPEVFHPRAKEIGEAKARLCAAAGFEGIFPLDTSLELTGLSKA